MKLKHLHLLGEVYGDNFTAFFFSYVATYRIYKTEWSRYTIFTTKSYFIGGKK